jgi:hypothetical protein
MVDIGELERSQLADRDGHALPLSAHFGSFELGDASEAPNAMMTVVTGSGIYNPTKGTCGYGTEVCCGASSFEEYPNTITATDGSVQQIDVSYVGCNGGTYNVVGTTTMSSSNTSVATVQSMGQPQPGMMAAVGVGTGYIYANYYSPTAIPVQVTITSQLPLPACPTTNGFSAAAPATVTMPNEIVVANDVTQTVSCSPYYTTAKARTITYTIQAGTTPIQGPIPIYENVPVTQTTCVVGNVQTGSTCTPNNDYLPETINQFDDFLKACPTSSSPNPCGFTFANQQWQYCQPNGTKSSIGTVGKVTALNTGVTLDGNSTALPKGTVFK